MNHSGYLSLALISKAVKYYIDKADKQAVPRMTKKQMEKIVAEMNPLEVGDHEGFEKTLETIKNKKKS